MVSPRWFVAQIIRCAPNDPDTPMFDTGAEVNGTLALPTDPFRLWPKESPSAQVLLDLVDQIARVCLHPFNRLQGQFHAASAVEDLEKSNEVAATLVQRFFRRVATQRTH